MAQLLVTDELWEIVEPLLPAPKPRRFRNPGRKPVDNRVALTAILHVLKSGCAWEDVPQELGCCGMTAWKKLHEWQKAGVWQELHQVMLSKLQQADKLDWSREVGLEPSAGRFGQCARYSRRRGHRSKPHRSCEKRQ